MDANRSRAAGWPVWSLATGQLLSYASQYFLLAGLVLFLTRDLGWAKSTLALGPMVSLLICAVLSPWAGRLVDNGRGPEAMVFGACLGAVGLVVIAFSQTPTQWIIGWAISGVGQSMSHYDACFAFLVRRLGPDARKAIIRVTLVAGFCSTVSIPAYAAMASTFGWRTAVLCAAAVVLLVVAPINFFATRAIRRLTAIAQTTASDAPAPPAPPPSTARLRKKAILSTIFALTSLNQWMIASFMVPILVLQGYSDAEAVFVTAFMGPSQVLGRLVLMRYEAHISNAKATMASLLCMVFAAMMISLSGLGLPLAIAYAAAQGAAIGTMTILRPVLIADIMGPENFGAVAGAIMVPSIMAGALAPMVGALVLEGPGLSALIALSFTLCALSIVAMRLLRR